jgi:hypothetical protein
VLIAEIASTETPGPGFAFFGQQVDITAPDASVENPLVLTFNLHSWIATTDPNAVEIFKDSVLVGSCTDVGATPDPCVESRVLVGDNIQIVIRTSTASRWSFGQFTENMEATKCQKELIKRADKLENTVLKEVNHAKMKALMDETGNSDAALEEQLQAVFSFNDKVNRAQDRLVMGVDRKCAVLEIPPGTVFSGKCGEEGPNLSEVEACVIAAARCEACLKINAFDDLNLNCDQADDQDSTNGSCP